MMKSANSIALRGHDLAGRLGCRVDDESGYRHRVPAKAHQLECGLAPGPLLLMDVLGQPRNEGDIPGDQHALLDELQLRRARPRSRLHAQDSPRAECVYGGRLIRNQAGSNERESRCILVQQFGPSAGISMERGALTPHVRVPIGAWHGTPYGRAWGTPSFAHSIGGRLRNLPVLGRPSWRSCRVRRRSRTSRCLRRGLRRSVVRRLRGRASDGAEVVRAREACVEVVPHGLRHAGEDQAGRHRDRRAGRPPETPALQTSTSVGPSSSSIAATAISSPSRSRTSATAAQARPPASRSA